MILDNCKLTYFGITGRGEATRLALSIGKVKFNDDRIAFADWKEIKPTTPWGSVPILTLSDGTTTIAQQRAILRFVGKEVGLYPTDDSVKAAKIDELMDATEDINAVTFKVGQGLEKEAKEAARKEACEEGGPVHSLLTKIEKSLGTSSSFAVGDTLTVADLFIYCTCNNLVSGIFDGVPENALDSFDRIMSLRKAVRSTESVCKWYDSLDSSIKIPASYNLLA